MAVAKLSTALIAVAVLLGTGAAAQAQTKPMAGSASLTTQTTNLPAQDPLAPAGVRKTLQWDNKTGKWGLKLETTRDAKDKEAEVGAYYRVTPSLRVGGALGLTNVPNPQQPVETDPNQPRVRIESALKF
jgi:hypothetical protein